jgi:hypothetical protein
LKKRLLLSRPRSLTLRSNQHCTPEGNQAGKDQERTQDAPEHTGIHPYPLSSLMNRA